MSMRATLGAVLGVAFTAAAFAGASSVRSAPQTAAEQQCGLNSSSQLRTTLYFGLARPKGTVSELEWQMFLRDEVTARFPDGLTVWEAEGQWRRAEGGIGHERSKVLLLVHPDSPAAREAVQSVIGRYRKMFDQESALWETARVCAAF
jgi:Protein of unknown function (DUF3574)